ncbi:helix-turn-helix domain-containing protein [Azospirillum sp. TSO22-1]|uniref:GlxA family transcriptional regulator n=1 Tax=Azospirillum sp. TSO22-1 TaxID=716789 RepID=UPI000D610B8C|nr:helix-turn-helix domain-containing protein [Azospirillum sp. TSO22-1]PWC31941.1 AraC family transcriptional regulator [Azospirillum sp. TSO22-1]
MIDVTVLFLDGGMLSTAIGPMEVFRCTGVLWNLLTERPVAPRFRVTTASFDGGGAQPDELVTVTPTRSLAEIDHTDLIFIPAAGLTLASMAETGYDVDAAIARNARVIPWLRAQWSRGAQIAAVCSGVALPAAAGLLDGRPATTHWGIADLFRQRFPDVDWQPEYLVTDSAGLYCGGGINAAADLSLYLVEKFCGRELTMQVAKAMLLEMPRTWQVAFAHLPASADHHDPAIQRAQDWIHAHYNQDTRFEALAQHVGMSPRNFLRRFKEATGRAPLAYLQNLRIATAKRHLETGRLTVQQVGSAVGYDDAIFFRSLFKRHTGLTPAEYRQRFGKRPLLAAE